MTSRTASGAQLRPGSLRGKYAPLPSNSILSPSSPINAGRAPLESGDLAETVRDRVAMGFFLFFLSGVAAFLGVVVAVVRAIRG